MMIAFGMICAGILPMPLVYLLRRFQVLKVDLDIHQGSIRRNETTASTKEMIDQDDDVSLNIHNTHLNFTCFTFFVIYCERKEISFVSRLNNNLFYTFKINLNFFKKSLKNSQH